MAATAGAAAAATPPATAPSPLVDVARELISQGAEAVSACCLFWARSDTQRLHRVRAPPPSRPEREPSLTKPGRAPLSLPAPQRVFTATLLGRPCVVKERFKKEYRHPVLDERITRERLLAVRQGRRR
jgi:hypothetical protein